MRGTQMRQGVVLGVLALAALWLTSLIWGLAGKAHIAIRQEADAKRQYESLEARKATLGANLAELSTARGQDAAIRTAFGVARAGEEVIVVVPPASSTASSTPGFWQRVWSWL